jgi:hypothetical protein
VNELEAPKNWMDFWLAKISAHPGLGVWSRAVFFVIEGGLPYLTRLRRARPSARMASAEPDGLSRIASIFAQSARMCQRSKRPENSSLIFLEESNASVLKYFALKTCTQRANSEKWRIPYRL